MQATPFAVPRCRSCGIRASLIAVLFCFAFSAVAATVRATECFDYGIDPTPVLGASVDRVQARNLSLELVGDLAYLGDQLGDPGLGGVGRINVVDVGNPAAPTLVHTVDLWTYGSFGPEALFAYDSYLYAGSFSTFAVLDIGSPLPSPAGAVGTMGIQGFALLESDPMPYLIAGRALPSFGDGWVNVFDVSNPGAPSQVAELPLAGNDLSRVDVATAGHMAYVSVARWVDHELLAVDLQTPSAPAIAGALPLPAAPRCVRIDGDLAYVGASGWLFVVDLSVPTSPQLIGAVDVNVSTLSIAVDGDRVYGSSSFATFAVDVSDPSAPWLLGHTFPPRSQMLALRDGILHVTSDVDEPFLTTIDPAALEVAPALGGDPAIYFRHARLWGSYLVTADPFSIVDVADPTAPFEVATLGGFSSERLDVDGSLAYVAAGFDGLQVVDVLDPVSPTVIGSIQLAEPVRDVAVHGGFAYAATGGGVDALHVLDVSNPAMPQPLGGVGDGILRVATDGALVIAGGFQGDDRGVSSIDVSDPAAPAVLGTWPGASILDMQLDGSLVFVVGLVNGGSVLAVIDFGNPAAPVELALLPVDPEDRVRSLSKAGDLLYLAHRDEGVLVFDVSVPSAPVWTGRITGSSGAETVVASVGAVHQSILPFGFFIHPPDCGATTSIHTMSPRLQPARVSAAPNPMSGSVRLELDLPGAPVVGTAELSVYDVQGRLVEVPTRVPIEGGRGVHVWSGPRMGDRAANGVYFARWTWEGGGSQTQRITIVR